MKEGWEYIAFKDVYPIKMGKTPPRGDKSSWDEKKETHNKWVSIADISNNEGKIIEDTKEYISDSAAEKINKVSKGSLLMSFKLSIGRMAFAGDDLYTNEAIIAIPESNKFILRFIYYYLLQYNWLSLTEGNEKVKGATLNKTSIGNIQLPVLSLTEQQSIVDYLDSAFAKIDTMKTNAEKALNEAQALFQASLKEMLEPKEGWEEKKIKDIGSVIGGTTPNTNVAEFWDGTLCWISPAELDGSHYLYDSKKKITEAAVKAKSLKLLPEGTVILSSRAPIGKVVINKVPTYCNQGFKCVVCGKEIYNEFLYWWFWGNTQYLNSLGTGATFKEISKKVVEEILIPVPSLSEQQSIATTLDSLKSKVDHLQENYDKISQECDALKQAILRQVFE